MLFSDENVAKEINDKFEPVWVSVREVPTVTIDFGNGHKIKRTLHGNVASYVLTADGTIVDILPGLYERDEYVKQLNNLFWVHHYIPLSRNAQVFLADYHREQAQSIKTSGKALEVRPFADMSKMAIEISTKTILRPPGWSAGPKSGVKPTATVEHPDFSKPGELAHWRKLFEDTAVNERERRGPVHAMLLAHPGAKPADVTKQLYREVLHADIDDPYLGLGETLFKDYPFTEDNPEGASKASLGAKHSAPKHSQAI
ncbi:MAG: hypothetical protein DKT66_22575 [Candidatus Melainabacteria bacterium]|nr:MAG: hypothetical protein DKT66_22575 [Candidatus Melainabacteria bacterium]